MGWVSTPRPLNYLAHITYMYGAPLYYLAASTSLSGGRHFVIKRLGHFIIWWQPLHYLAVATSLSGGWATSLSGSSHFIIWRSPLRYLAAGPLHYLAAATSLSGGRYLAGLFPLSQHFEKSNSHIANILMFTPEWSAGYSLFSLVTECVMNYL